MIELQKKNSRLADTSLSDIRTPSYYGMELKSWRIRITDSPLYYSHQILAPMMSVIKSWL